MKKWENPKLESLKFENTEHGTWKYLYQCSNIGNGCDYYDFSVSPNLERNCICGGTIRMVDKHWSDGYCEDSCTLS